MDHQHALVDQQRVRLPRGIRAGSAEVIAAALLEGGDPGDLRAVVKMAIEQQPLFKAVHDGAAALLQFGRRGHLCGRDDRAACQSDTAFVEHVRIDVDGHPPALLHNRAYGSRQRRHVIPMPVAHCNALDLAHWDPEIGAVADKNGWFRPSVEQQSVPDAVDPRHQPQAVAEIAAQQRLTRDRLSPGAHDIGELGDREQRLGDIIVADIVGQHIDGQTIDGIESVADLGHSATLVLGCIQMVQLCSRQGWIERRVKRISCRRCCPLGLQPTSLYTESYRMPNLDAAFSALADPTRRAILARLASGEATVMELAEPFEMTQPAVSRHLKVLEGAGLIVRRIEGTKRPRRLAPTGIDAVDRWLAMLRDALAKKYGRLDEVLAAMKTERREDMP